MNPRVGIVLLLAFTVRGQTVSTQILGLVTDASGAMVPGAVITAKRIETGDVRSTVSNETGNYIFPLVDSGTYDVTCAAAGFKSEMRRGVSIELQQKARLDFQMQLGQQTEMVEVTSAAPLLKTEDATLGSVVEHRRIIELPLNGRNFAQAATLMPGVVYGSARMGIDGNSTIGTRAMPGPNRGPFRQRTARRESEHNPRRRNGHRRLQSGHVIRAIPGSD